MKAREELDNAKKEAWEAKNDPVKKAALIAMKAQDTSKMSKEDRNKFRSMELAETRCEQEMAEMNAMIQKCEEEMQSYDDRKAELAQECKDFEMDHRVAENYFNEAEERMAESEAREKSLIAEEEQMKKDREFLEDEYAAAIAPPPKNSELIRLEEQVENAKLRNIELRDHEESIYARERKYEDLCVKAENAWKLEEEEKEAEERRRDEEAKAAKGGQGSSGRRLIEDPLLLAYYERYELPEVANQKRYINMYTDVRARERRLQKMRQERLASEAEKLLASAESVGVFGAGFAAPKQADYSAPTTFRHDEDLRVRLAGSSITVGHVENVLSEHQAQTAELAGNLRRISSQICSYGAESFRLHAEARSHLEAMEGGGAGQDFPENVLTR